MKNILNMNTLIISGGNINITFLKKHLETVIYDNIIVADKGLEAVSQLKITPNHIVGDLDSVNYNIVNHYLNNSDIILHKYAPEKDFTDTDIALNLAIQINSTHITIIGATGTRFDHTLANVHILCYTLAKNIPCEIIDEYNKIYIINSKITLKKSLVYGNFISLIPLTTTVSNLTLTGFKYTLFNYTLEIGKSLGISNEIVDSTATIDFSHGILVVIESKD